MRFTGRRCSSADLQSSLHAYAWRSRDRCPAPSADSLILALCCKWVYNHNVVRAALRRRRSLDPISGRNRNGAAQRSWHRGQSARASLPARASCRPRSLQGPS
ncbi:unnamed protein product [Urochloa humidicola]